MKKLWLSSAALMVWAASFAQVPAHYTQHITSKIAEVNQKEKLMGASGDVFLFFTDSHTAANTMTSTYLMREICTTTTAEKVFFGGDIVVAYGDEDLMYDCVMKHINTYDAVVSPYARTYSVIGNHDIIIKDKSDPQNPVSYTSSDEARYALIMKRQESYVNFDPRNPLGCYNYFDNEAQKIRYICLNGSERHSDTKTTWSDRRGFSPEQAVWLTGTALRLPDDEWGAIIFIHCGMVEPVHKNGFRDFAVLKEILDAYNAKRPYSFKGESQEYQYHLKTNFSRSKGRLIAVFSGHTHSDLFCYSEGVPHIVTANDCQYHDDGIRRTRGTTDECCFDVACYDKKAKILSLVRVGAGSNRTIHLEKPTRLTVNSSATLTPAFIPARWSVSDSSCMTIDQGRITALRNGEVTVTAADRNNNKEYFNVIVR